MNPIWWRAYNEALHDPKVIALSDRLHRAWFNLLCVSSKNDGVLPGIGTVAIELRISKHRAAEYVTALVVAGLFDAIEGGKFTPHNWRRRQFQSDVSTERVKRFRQQRRNVSVTPPETETETETENKPSEEAIASSSGPRTPSARATRLPDDWMPTAEDGTFAIDQGLTPAEAQAEFDKFRDHWKAKSGRDATKVDWSATWRNWIRNAVKWKGKPNANGRNGGKQSLGELADQLADEARQLELAGGVGRSDDPVRSH
jgi:hypothetical protein